MVKYRKVFQRVPKYETIANANAAKACLSVHQYEYANKRMKKYEKI